ncbi:hypothetical protein RBB50_009251 [Rhinocladiella similis]
MSSQFDEEWKARALAALSEIAPDLLAVEARLQKIISDYGRTSQGGEMRAIMRQLRSFFDLDAFIDAPALNDVLRSPSPPPPPPPSPAAEEAATAAASSPPAAAVTQSSPTLPPRPSPIPPAPPSAALTPAAPSPQEKSKADDNDDDDEDDDDARPPTKRRAKAPAKRKAVAEEDSDAASRPSSPKRQQRPRVARDAPVKKSITLAIRQQASLPKKTTVKTNKNKTSQDKQWRFVCDVKDCTVDRSTPGDFHAHMKNAHGRNNGWLLRRSCPPTELYWIAKDDDGKVYSGEMIEIKKPEKKPEKKPGKKQN